MIDIQFLENLANEYGDFSIIQYLRDSQSDYAIYQIDYENSSLIWSAGLNSPEVKQVSIERFQWGTSSIKAAYQNLKDVKYHARPVNLFLFDPFIFSEAYDIEQCKVLLFHEIIHFIQLTKYYLKLKVNFSTEDNEMGVRIANFANDVNDKLGIFGVDEFHNELFGSLLNYYFRNYDDFRRAELLHKALSHNFVSNEVNDYL